MSNINSWIVVHVTSGLLFAEIVKGRLESEGIPVRLSYEAVGKVYAITMDGLGEVRVLVPEDKADEAEAILAQTFREEDLDWDSQA